VDGLRGMVWRFTFGRDADDLMEMPEMRPPDLRSEFFVFLQLPTNNASENASNGQPSVMS
jgi:hypothetical protein